MGKVKRIRWVILLFSIMTASFFSYEECRANEFDSLREAKDAAWNTYYMEKIASETSMEKDIVVDGAVDTHGGAKVRIDDWSSKGILKKGSQLLVYELPEEGTAIGKLYADTIFSVMDTDGDFTRIHSGYLKGYVKSSLIYVDEDAKKKAEETSPVQILSNMCDTKVMKEADADSSVLGYMIQRQTYDIKSVKGDWYEIPFEDGVKGYVSLRDVESVQEIHFGRSLVDIEKPQQPFTKEYLSADDRRMLAAIIYCEARGEIFEGKVAVASVVMNRVHSEVFPDTIQEVIEQKDQFEPVLLNMFAEAMENHDQISASCYEAVDTVMQGGNNVDALYFRTGDVGITIGSHGFF